MQFTRRSSAERRAHFNDRCSRQNRTGARGAGSYAKILQHANERKLTLALSTREIYVKGPGMIFKGNPKNYLTEIQLPFKE